MKKVKTTGEIVHEGKPHNTEPCPKCGSTVGWSGPHYRPAMKAVSIDRHHPSKIRRIIETVPERLEWSCKVCGYTKHAPTKDATP